MPRAARQVRFMPESKSGVRVPGWLKEYVRHYGEALINALDVDPNGKILGCGFWGCVMPTNNPNWVVKLTVDPTEAGLIKRIMKIREESTGGADPSLSGIVLYRHAPFVSAEVRAHRQTLKVYVVVREAVDAPGFLARARSQGGARNWSGRLPSGERQEVTLPALIWTKVWAEEFYKRRGDKKERALQEYTDWVSKVSYDDGMEYIEQTLFQLLDEGVVLRDVHLGNVGKAVVDTDLRPAGTGIIFDLGHTPTDEEYTFAEFTAESFAKTSR